MFSSGPKLTLVAQNVQWESNLTPGDKDPHRQTWLVSSSFRLNTSLKPSPEKKGSKKKKKTPIAPLLPIFFLAKVLG
jgi:hypothetical protein